MIQFPAGRSALWLVSDSLEDARELEVVVVRGLAMIQFPTGHSDSWLVHDSREDDRRLKLVVGSKLLIFDIAPSCGGWRIDRSLGIGFRGGS